MSRDPEGYEDDEDRGWSGFDYPMDGGVDGDDDDGDSSLEMASGLLYHHPLLTLLLGLGLPLRASGTSISLPPEAEVERLLAMTTPSPSPPISLSPPSAGERLARCTAPPAHPPPLPPSSGRLTQIQTLRIASTQALIDAVTAALPPPPLLPLPPSLSIPSPVDRRDDIPESEQPPRKRLHLSTICSRYEIGESSTARPTRGQGIDYGFVGIVDAEERRQGIRDVGYGIRDTWVDPAEAVLEIAPMTVGEVNTKVVELAELHERDTQDLRQYGWWRRRPMLHVWAWARSIGLSQATHQELQTHRDHVYMRPRFQMHAYEYGQHFERTDRMAPRTLDSRGPMRLGLRSPEASGVADSHIYANLLNFQGAEGFSLWSVLTDGIEKMVSVFNISGCAIENQVKFATCTLLGAALTWWNGQIRTLGPEAYAMTWEVTQRKDETKYYPRVKSEARKSKL
ncbi:hypothetical protein Tco_0576485 [Tanacetum coccineum]